MRPRSTAFFASSPAASITDGFDVFVQLVIAAMTTDPWSSTSAGAGAITSWAAGDSWPPSPQTPTDPAPWLSPTAASFCVLAGGSGRSDGSVFANDCLRSRRGTRSCGRRGPATEGSIVPRSSFSTVAKSGSGEVALWNRPWSFMYASTIATRSSVRPLKRR